MLFARLRKIIAPLLLAGLLFVTACTAEAPSRWDAAQQESTQTQVPQDRAPAGQPLPGSTFNKFFPSGGGGYERVYTQEKQGFAQAKLKKGGQDVALLSISDTAANPSAGNKFQQSNLKIGGYPSVQEGSKGTAVLVGGRFQVKVQSIDSSFTQSDREAWLQRFNLNGLSRVR